MRKMAMAVAAAAAMTAGAGGAEAALFFGVDRTITCTEESECDTFKVEGYVAVPAAGVIETAAEIIDWNLRLSSPDATGEFVGLSLTLTPDNSTVKFFSDLGQTIDVQATTILFAFFGSVVFQTKPGIEPLAGRWQWNTTLEDGSIGLTFGSGDAIGGSSPSGSLPVVPVPAALPLLATALAGLGAAALRRG